MFIQLYVSFCLLEIAMFVLLTEEEAKQNN